MKTEVLCNIFNCSNNCNGKCGRKEISIILTGCTMFKPRNTSLARPIPREEDPASLR